MLNLYSEFSKIQEKPSIMGDREKFALIYHNLFDYPLDLSELIKWLPSEKFSKLGNDVSISAKTGYYYIQGREGLVYKRVLRKRISVKKMDIAKKAANLLSLVPGIKMVGVTGSLAMGNTSNDGDIDFILITRGGRLWTTRIFSYLALKIFGFKIRKPGQKEQKDKLCLNIWLDCDDLTWNKRDRNYYSAHEIAQIIPLINKDKTHEKLLLKNKWILQYWPNSIKMSKELKTLKIKEQALTSSLFNFPAKLLEKIAFRIQYRHMKPKITGELITATRALFHPVDWSHTVLSRLHL